MQGDTARVVDSTMFVSNVAQSIPQTSAPPPDKIAPLSPKMDQSLRILHSNPATPVRVDRLDFLFLSVFVSVLWANGRPLNLVIQKTHSRNEVVLSKLNKERTVRPVVSRAPSLSHLFHSFVVRL